MPHGASDLSSPPKSRPATSLPVKNGQNERSTECRGSLARPHRLAEDACSGLLRFAAASGPRACHRGCRPSADAAPRVRAARRPGRAVAAVRWGGPPGDRARRGRRDRLGGVPARWSDHGAGGCAAPTPAGPYRPGLVAGCASGAVVDRGRVGARVRPLGGGPRCRPVEPGQPARSRCGARVPVDRHLPERCPACGGRRAAWTRWARGFPDWCGAASSGRTRSNICWTKPSSTGRRSTDAPGAPSRRIPGNGAPSLCRCSVTAYSWCRSPRASWCRRSRTSPCRGCYRG